MSSIFSTSELSSGAAAPTPALLTSSVMSGLVRRIASTRARSVLSLRSAATVSTERPVSRFSRCARAASRVLSRATRIRS